MISAFFIFCFVINYRIFNFHFAGGEISLEIFHIGSGIPECPFYKRKDFELFDFIRSVTQRQLLNFGPCFQRNEI